MRCSKHTRYKLTLDDYTDGVIGRVPDRIAGQSLTDLVAKDLDEE